jgi:hypothetical protein
MSPEKPVPSTISGQAPSAMLRAGPTRFIGLDVHKHYLIAIGVDAELNQVLGPQQPGVGPSAGAVETPGEVDAKDSHTPGCSGFGDDH